MSEQIIELRDFGHNNGRDKIINCVADSLGAALAHSGQAAATFAYWHPADRETISIVDLSASPAYYPFPDEESRIERVLEERWLISGRIGGNRLAAVTDKPRELTGDLLAEAYDFPSHHGAIVEVIVRRAFARYDADVAALDDPF